MSDRIEYEYGWMAFGVLLGMAYILAITRTSHQVFLPGWAVIIWALGLLAGGCLGIVGCAMYRHRPYGALLFELAGVAAQNGAITMIGFAIVWSWTHAADSATPWLGVSLISVWLAINVRRFQQIMSEIKRRNTPAALPPLPAAMFPEE